MSSSTKRTKPVRAFTLAPEVLVALDEHADRAGRFVSNVVEDALRAHLNLAPSGQVEARAGAPRKP